MEVLGSLPPGVGRVIAGSIVAVATLNDCVAVLNAWLLVPIGDQISAAVLSVLLFAVLESATLFFLRGVSIRPWIMVLAWAPTHLSSGAMTFALWRTAGRGTSDEQQGKDAAQSYTHVRQGKVVLWPSIISAAISNGTFLLWSSVQAPLDATMALSSQRTLDAFVLLLFLVSRLADYQVWTKLQAHAQCRGTANITIAVLFLTLHVSRISFRALSGIEILVGLPVNPAVADVTSVTMEQGNVLGLDATSTLLITVAVALANVGLTFIAQHFFHKAALDGQAHSAS